MDAEKLVRWIDRLWKWYKPVRWLICNRFFYIEPLDPIAWFEWWNIGAPIRIYNGDRSRWITILSGDRRTEKIFFPNEEVDNG